MIANGPHAPGIFSILPPVYTIAKLAQFILAFPPNAKFDIPNEFIARLPKLFFHWNKFCPFPKVRLTGPTPSIILENGFRPIAQLSPIDWVAVPSVWYANLLLNFAIFFELMVLFINPKPPVVLHAPIAAPTTPDLHAPSQPPPENIFIPILVEALFTVELAIPHAFDATFIFPTVVVIPVA